MKPMQAGAQGFEVGADPVQVAAFGLPPALRPFADGARLASSQLRAFYADLAQARAAAAQCDEAEAVALVPTLSRRLVQTIELHSLTARRAIGAPGADLEHLARFIKASLADEVLLNLAWPGREMWRDHLIERQLFGTSHAGDRIFEEIEAVLGLRDPSVRSRALLLLHALSLGFEGRYRGAAERGELARLRGELFRLAYERPPDLDGAASRLCESAYESTLTRAPVLRLRRRGRAAILAMAALFALLLLSEAIWLWRTWPVRRLLDEPVADMRVGHPLAQRGDVG